MGLIAVGDGFQIGFGCLPRERDEGRTDGDAERDCGDAAGNLPSLDRQVGGLLKRRKSRGTVSACLVKTAKGVSTRITLRTGADGGGAGSNAGEFCRGGGGGWDGRVGDRTAKELRIVRRGAVPEGEI
jgi:hypothetical protein